VNSAIIGEHSDGPEGDWEGEPIVAYARVKYSVGIIWKPRRDAVIVGDPSPIDDIAGPDGDSARVKVGPALSDVHIYRRRGGEDWQHDQKYERQAEMHLEDSCCGRIPAEANTETCAHN
jgi:hypothetical protein